MLEKIITFALQQRVFVLAGALVLVIVGLRATDNLPIEAFPDVQDVQVQIVTQVAGQAPEEVERSVTLPIERDERCAAHDSVAFRLHHRSVGGDADLRGQHG